jgi:DnaJ family protein C protein 17
MALDAKIRLVSAKKERYSAYDAKRKAMVADLEEREAAFKKTRADKDRDERSKWTDNERIKEEGRKLREARQRRMEEAEEATKPKPSSRQATPSEDEPPEIGVPCSSIQSILRANTVRTLGSLDTTVRLKYALSKHPTLTAPAALAAVLGTFGAVDAEASVVSLKPPKKAPHKPPKNATALIVFTTIGAAFAAVDASGRRERGLEGIEVCWAGGGEPPLIGWLKKKGMFQNSHAQGSPPPGTPLSTSAAPAVPPQGKTFPSFPDTYVRPWAYLSLLR